MPTLGYAVALLLAIALERAWPEPLRWGAVTPDLGVLLVACVGITRGPVAGCAVGLAAGFLTASVAEGGFGAILMSHMVVGFLCGHARGRVFSEHVLVAPVIAALVVVLASCIELAVSPPSHFLPWLGALGRSVVYTAVVSPPAYLYASAINRRWPRRAEA